ncbi:hypothetical protein CDA63_10180 [Hymenobacter amundsenii]|uniref:Uncharacterized protein n=2 Tax=Hymenobacter amundsenii TaxID=2006685 RepID=A0A2D0AFM4_9BACT|nr:hypothetical protein CDA63_10180 [Hymenobacter amundsenii]
MTTALAACCGSTACDCNDTFADAVGLRFDTLGTSSSPAFKVSELRTVFLVRRLLRPDAQQLLLADTVQLERTTLQARQPLILNNTTPFSQAGNRKLDQYAYRVYLAPTRTAKIHSFDYAIDSVQLTTEYQADGCCTCFNNTRKLVYVNGSASPINLKDADGENGLVELNVLRKP